MAKKKPSSSVAAKTAIQTLLQNGWDFVKSNERPVTVIEKDSARRYPDTKLSNSGHSLYMEFNDASGDSRKELKIQCKGMLSEGAVSVIQRVAKLRIPLQHELYPS